MKEKGGLKKNLLRIKFQKVSSQMLELEERVQSLCQSFPLIDTHKAILTVTEKRPVRLKIEIVKLFMQSIFGKIHFLSDHS